MISANQSNTAAISAIHSASLTGRYDFNLDFNFDGGKPFEGPTIFEAVQRQLGLKLEAGKDPVEVVTIDHVEKPSVN